MQKMHPCLWFDNNAGEAVRLYTSVFDGSSIDRTTYYEEGSPMPAGTIMTIEFKLSGQKFMALNGGPHFRFSPAVSFFVTCSSEEEFNSFYSMLSFGGEVLMEPGDYSFSKQFAWINDRFGLSWQFNLPHPDSYMPEKKITPFMMFTGSVAGKASEAADFYTSVFNNSVINSMDKYGNNEEGLEGTVRLSHFTLDDCQFMAIDSSLEHNFNFTGAISFFVNCSSQKEVDWFWDKLSEGGVKSRCGWLNDKYGIYWQIVPAALGEMLNDPDPVKSRNVVQAMLKMDKLDIAALKAAYEG